MENISLKAVIKTWILAHKVPIIISLVVLVSTGIVISEKILDITENPDFCGKNCHIMRPYYDSWSESAHNNVRCIECHYEPGLIGHLKGKINGLTQFFSYETTNSEKYTGQLSAKVTDENCLACHEKRIFSSDNNFNGVNFTHSNHPIELSCITCHSDVKHAPTIKAICSSCHESMHTKDWLVTHKTQILFMGKACTECHLQKYCDDCHASGNTTSVKVK
ncbi:Class III cytochrome C family protein [uncultured archaeon]|nr:Class III cytochrome C family protein [uncultured archaeon]